MCFVKDQVWADELYPTCAAGPVLVAGCYGLFFNYGGQDTKPVDLYYKKAQKMQILQCTVIVIFVRLLQQESILTQVTTLQRKKTTYYTARYSLLSNIQGWRTQMEN